MYVVASPLAFLAVFSYNKIGKCAIMWEFDVNPWLAGLNF
jgi:hypothetical protein